MTKRDLNLNSLGRYAKQSRHLILEQHSHCEVPAGCGGAVLRWRSDDSGLIFLLSSFCDSKATVLLDGMAIPSARPLVSFGHHVLTIAIEQSAQDLIFAFAAVHDETEFGLPHSSKASVEAIRVLSDADGTWKCTTGRPGDAAWTKVGFDDSSWSKPALCKPPKFDEKDFGRWQLKRATDAGAKCLQVGSRGEMVWIRREFHVPRPSAWKEAST